jgi:hypothetical protein
MRQFYEVYPDPPDYKKVRNYWKWLKN